MRPGQHTVWLALDARNVDLCESVLHECCHIAQVTRKTIRAAGAEAEAVAFASRWGRAVMAAHSLSGGDSSRVVVRKTRRPWYDVPAGSVVLHRGGCYGHNPFNSGPSWTWRSAA